MAAPAPTTGGGNILTRKLGPLPGWAWAAVAVGGYLIYKQRKASAAAASTPATTSTAALTPGAQAPSGYGYQGPGTAGGNYGYQIPPSATATTGSGYTPPTGETASGAGYAPTTSGGSVTDSQGNVYTELTSIPQIQAANANGTPVYIQITPGVFEPYPPGTGPGSAAALGTPAYIMSQPAVGVNQS